MENENTMVPEITPDAPVTPVAEETAAPAEVPVTPVAEETATPVEAPAEAPVATPAAPAPEKRCPNCQALVDNSLSFCPECGTPLKNLCKNCGEELADGQTFCPKCGQRTEIPVVAPNPIDQFNANLATNNKKKKTLPIIIGVAVALVLAIVLFSNSGPDFGEMFSDIAGEEWCYIASDGSYMEIDSNPDDIDSDSSRFDYVALLEASSAIERINKELGFPDSVYKKMTQTRSLDGRLTEENDNYKVSWTYHPDSGLEVLYEAK